MKQKAAIPGTLFIIALVMVSALLRVYYSRHGFISPDSGNYLRLAQNLEEGKGFFTTDACANGGTSYFATWPVGYPVLIWLMSIATGSSVFWASKILNLLLLVVSAYLLFRLFRNNFVFALPVFFIDSYTDILAYSWSENLFIPACFLFVTGLASYHRKPSFSNLLIILCACLLSFFSKYVGIFILIPLSAAGIWYFRKGRKKDAIRLFAAGIAVVLVCSVYLFLNYILTGYITGVGRPAPDPSFSQLLNYALLALKQEINLFNPGPSWLMNVSFAISLVIVTTLVLCYFKTVRQAESRIMVSLGLFWLALMILLSFVMHFDRLGFRLLGPGAILVAAGLLFQCAALPDRYVKRLKILIPVACLLFVSIQIYIHTRPSPVNVNQSLKSISEDYRVIPAGSMVINAEPQAFFLRTDLSFLHIELHAASANCISPHVYLRKRVVGGSNPELVPPQFKHKLDSIKSPTGFAKLR